MAGLTGITQLFLYIINKVSSFMREIISGHIHAALAARSTFFIRKQDIQLYLASWLMNTQFYEHVFIEYHIPGVLVPPYLLTDSSNSFLDIVVEKNGVFYPVAIHYKTAAQALERLVFGQAVITQLQAGGAQNAGCYDFWKDIRLHEFLEASFPAVQRGFVLFVSNDTAYKKAPNKPNAGYAAFSIHDGREVMGETILNWNVLSHASHTRPGFAINYDYSLRWTTLAVDNKHAYLLA
jgi:hypothetical protein